MADKHKISVQVDLLAKVDQFSDAIANMQKQLSGLKLNKSITENLEGNISNIEKEMKKISDISQKGEVNIIDEKEILKSFNKVERAWSSILNKLKSAGANTAVLEKDKKAIDAIVQKQTAYTNEVKKTKKEQEKLQKALDDAKKKQQEFNKIQQDLTEKRKAKTIAQQEVDDRIKNNKKHVTADKNLSAAESALKEADNKRKQVLGGKTITAYSAEVTAEIAKATKELEEFEKTSKSAEASFKGLITGLKNISDINWEEMGINLDQINTVEQLEEALEKLKKRAGEDGAKALETLRKSAEGTDDALEKVGTEINRADEELKELTQHQKDIDDLRNRLLNFFSINNAAQIFQRALRNAYQAIKELDEVMTQTAVVTDFSVGDMWSQLPEYTDRANELGVAVKGVYEASTLYYQQGLKTEEVVAVSTETLKMAKIAGLDYADATDFMTAALRGFNMEVNETNSLRINDVYSELAAITAADTSEIAKAMTKTASIASNANMEFETTAAFLSQIIETTRESAETAGTAMKTVIARFQELKKDPSEIGEVDGEIVDANKIETALRTVGVALRDSNGQFRDLDDVFLELAKKWKSLDTNTQRYIATIAAGSRQQSRFIAMMSNYERTMELVNAANNSAGASQKQFDKTLESLASKLERLSNAWNEFSMGIANSTVIKTGIDLLTTLLETINGLTSAFGDVGGAIAKVGLGFAAFAGGNKLFKGKLMTSLVKGVFGKDAEVVGGKAGQEASEGFLKSFSDKIQNTKDISNKTGKNLFSSFFFSGEFAKIDPFKFRQTIMGSDLNELEKAKFSQKITDAQLDQDKLHKISLEAKDLGIDIKAQKLTSDFKAMGGALTAAGMAASFLGKQLEDAGYEKAGNVITNLGTAASGFGAAISVLGPMATAAGGAIATAFGPVMIILGAVTAGAIILNEVIETAAEKEERLNKQLEESKQLLNDVTSKYEELKNAIDSLNSAENTLDTLIEGSEAWKEQLEEVNNQIINILEKYPELKRYVEFKDGRYEWTDGGAALEAIKQREVQNKRNAQNMIYANQRAITENKTTQFVSGFNGGVSNRAKGDKNKSSGATPVKISKEDIDNLATLYAENNNILKDRELLTKSLGNNGPLATKIVSMSETLEPILQEIASNTAYNKERTKAGVSGYLTGNNTYDSSSNKNYLDTRIASDFEASKNNIINNLTALEVQEYYKQMAKDMFGENAYVIQNTATGQLEFAYRDGEGKTQTYAYGNLDAAREDVAFEKYMKERGSSNVEKYQQEHDTALSKVLSDVYGTTIEKATEEQLFEAKDILNTAANKAKPGQDLSLDEAYVEGLEGASWDTLYGLSNSEDNALREAALAAMKAKANVARQANKTSLETSDATKYADELQKVATAYEVNEDAIKAYRKELSKIPGLQDEIIQDQVITLEIKFNETDKRIDEIYDESIALLKKSVEEKPLTLEDYNSADNLAKALQPWLGEDIDADFVIEYDEQVLDFLNGSTEAVKELQDAASQKILVELEANLNDDQYEYLVNFINEYDGYELEINANLLLNSNFDELKNNINNALRSGALTKDQAQNLLASMGIGSTYKEVTHSFMEKKEGGSFSIKNEEGLMLDTMTNLLDNTRKPKYTPPTEDKDKGEEDYWENPYDKQYNTLEKIDELLRQRELLEKQYQKLQTKGEANYENTKKYYDDLFASLTEEAKLQKQLHDDIVKDELNPFLANNKNLAQYATYSEETGLLQIEWDKIEALETAAKEQGETLEKEIAELKRLSKAIEQSADQQAEIEVNRANAEKELQDAYLAFEERIAAALENIEREALEEQQKLFDALTSAEEQLVDALNRNIDEMRQARENEQRQQEISDKERRLAYLRQDTTGANQLEIRQLEKEIGEEKENYRDELIDQSLEKLQKQNEAAAEQREKQISLMESQIEYAVENGLYNKEAAQMLKNASKNGFAYDPKIWNTLRNGENWDAKTETAVKAVKDAVKQDLATAIVALANSLGTKTSLSNSNNNSSGGGGSSGRTFSAHGSTGTYTIGSEKGITFLVGAQPGDTLTSSDTGDKSTWTMGSDGTATITTQNGDSFTINRADLGLKPFATGGLADFTGPAWLDGTRSKPELVLNAQDTENFLILKDVLSGVLANAPGAKSSGGDNYFDIDVNVDEIGSDYDVDQMAERIKQNIYQDGMYRNVNTINLLR